MALPTLTPGYQFVLYIGTTVVCGIESGSMNGSVNAIEAMVRDCSSPEGMPTRVAAPGVETWEFTGAGKYVKEHYDDIEDTLGAAPTTWKVEDAAGSIWTGSFLTTGLNLDWNADGSSYADISLTLISSGTVTYTPAA